MDVQDYVTISKYYQYCWTGKREGLRHLFTEDVVHKHISNFTNKLQEKTGIDSVMKEYDTFFNEVDLNSTKVSEVKIYKGKRLTARYKFYQEKGGEKCNFKVKQTFKCTPEGLICYSKMNVTLLPVIPDEECEEEFE